MVVLAVFRTVCGGKFEDAEENDDHTCVGTKLKVLKEYKFEDEVFTFVVGDFVGIFNMFTIIFKICSNSFSHNIAQCHMNLFQFGAQYKINQLYCL